MSVTFEASGNITKIMRDGTQVGFISEQSTGQYAYSFFGANGTGGLEKTLDDAKSAAEKAATQAV